MLRSPSREILVPHSSEVAMRSSKVAETRHNVSSTSTCSPQTQPEDTIDMKNKSKFNLSRSAIAWTRWSWNPVTGCKHKCEYCYARPLANRFHRTFPNGFKPTFLPERLGAPHNTRIPKRYAGDRAIHNVFMCSMADLFGKWVPQKWIDAVMDAVRGAPQWNFFFLTKSPERLTTIDWPANAAVGTTVDTQARVEPAVEIFSQLDAPLKFLSCEPLLEELTFPTMDCFNWVMIGPQSSSGRTREVQPDPRWVTSLVGQARSAGCRIYTRPGLRSGEAIREYPELNRA